MTLKNIIKMATDSEIKYCLEKIQFYEENMCNYTKHEVQSRQSDIKWYAGKIKSLLENKEK